MDHVQVDQLQARKRALEVEIESEEHSLHPDNIKLSELKKQKLKIKDEIARLDHH
ncbi:MAG: DUF465 domain-containing protein [Alphaproteobacteria bacterium]|nr:DUF465 domain-containing protein [Alphaproteobacteria bacterium]